MSTSPVSSAKPASGVSAAPKLPTIAVSSNDMSQRVEKTGQNVFTVRGVASNRGFVASAIELKVGAKNLRIPQSGGMAPTDIAKAIKRALPKGFQAKVEELPYKPGPGARAPVSITITQAGGASGGGRLMSPVAYAKANLADGRQITALITGRGGKDLLKNPAALEKMKVGEFDGARIRGGTLKNTVYVVRTAGPDDRPVNRLIVKVAVPQPNDAVRYKYLDLGPLAKGGPNV